MCCGEGIEHRSEQRGTRMAVHVVLGDPGPSLLDREELAIEGIDEGRLAADARADAPTANAFRGAGTPPVPSVDHAERPALRSSDQDPGPE